MMTQSIGKNIADRREAALAVGDMQGFVLAVYASGSPIHHNLELQQSIVEHNRAKLAELYARTNEVSSYAPEEAANARDLELMAKLEEARDKVVEEWKITKARLLMAADIVDWLPEEKFQLVRQGAFNALKRDEEQSGHFLEFAIKEAIAVLKEAENPLTEEEWQIKAMGLIAEEIVSLEACTEEEETNTRELAAYIDELRASFPQPV